MRTLKNGTDCKRQSDRQENILLPEWKHTESGMELFTQNAVLYSWSKEKEAV